MTSTSATEYECDGVRGAGELPSIGAFADDLHDGVVDEVVLELVVGELPGEPELLDRVSVAALSVDPQRRGVHSAAPSFVVAGPDNVADLVPAESDAVRERGGGDDRDVLVGGVDEVAVIAADVVLRVRQPLEKRVGPDVQASGLQGLISTAGSGELGELGVPVLGVVRRQPVAGGVTWARRRLLRVASRESPRPVGPAISRHPRGSSARVR
ncbi:hypothetical protein ACWD5F_04890 [Streptomyces sp. NPDC002499]